MKILHVSSAFFPGYSHGGIIPAFYELCRSLGRLGCEVKVLTTDAAGDGRAMEVDCEGEVRLAESFDVRYCKYLMGRAVSPTLLRLLPAYIRWADVVHLSSVYNFPTIPTLLLCRIMGRPLLWSPHGALQRWDGSRRRRLKVIWEWICAAVGPPSLRLHVTCEQEAAASRAKFPGYPSELIPYCVPVPEEQEKAAIQNELSLLYLGRLDPKKGIENLLEACRILCEHNRLSWSLTIAGGGTPQYTHALQARIRALLLVSKVRMMGEVVGQAKEALFAHADVLIVPSHTENFGLVVAEALLRNVPVIASKGTPWSELEAHCCGLWVENDPGSLADAIERISHLPLREMGSRGRSWIQDEIHPDSIGRRMYEAYQRLLTEQRRFLQSLGVLPSRL
ncbi:MAG TPA: glycosyltransferase [Nitrospira sp.]|nr:glycosyltransferase [Nitrospira sp.]